jgi:drug/metabolite transporter (DMT)-like permease
LLGLNFIGFQEGVHYAGPAISQVIIQLGPVTLAFVGFIVFRESSSPLKIAGFILAAVGFFFFFFQQMNSLPSEAASIKLGVIYLVAGAWTWTGYAIINKILIKRIASLQINLILYAVPTLLYLPFVDFGTLFQAHSLMVWLLLLFVALNTLIAYGSLSAAMKYTEANKISIIVTLNPVITFIIMECLLWLDISWFDAPGMTPLTYMGAAMVIGGAVLAVGAKSRGHHRPDKKI